MNQPQPNCRAIHPSRAALLLWPLVLTACVLLSATCVSAAAFGPADDNPVKGSLVTGALVQEQTVAAVVSVDATKRLAGSVPTIAEGLKKTRETLRRGIPTKITIGPGVYRESAADIRFDEPIVRDTLLVIEGTAVAAGDVVWSGADIFPASEWKNEGGGIWSHDWPYNFGNFAYPWSVPGVLGHRREMVWIAGQPLRPVLLETYDVKGLASFGETPVSWTYTGFRTPQMALTAGTFGVAERPENGKRLYVCVAPGAKLPATGIEVAVRPTLLNLAGKSGVVLRGITFEKCANSDKDFGAESPVTFGPNFREEDHPGDVLLERCRFRWNSGSGFTLNGGRWTVRDCDFSYNGFGGLSSNDARNVLFERVSANFNCWREFFSGSEDWNYGAVKMHGVTGHLVRGYTAIGNATHGIWWDVHCADVTFEDAVLIRNRRSFIFELSQGPFIARRILAAHGFRQATKNNAMNPACIVATSQRARIEDSLFYTDSAPEVTGFLWYERDDPHAKLKRHQADLFEMRGCVIVGGSDVRFLLREGNVGDRKRESYRSFRYQGQNNVFYRRGDSRDVFGYSDSHYNLVKLDFAAWINRSEIGGRWLDPRLRDPARYDFRFAPDSPLKSDLRRLPQYVMPSFLRTEMKQFFAWIAWNAPP